MSIPLYELQSVLELISPMTDSAPYFLKLGLRVVHTETCLRGLGITGKGHMAKIRHSVHPQLEWMLRPP